MPLDVLALLLALVDAAASASRRARAAAAVSALAAAAGFIASPLVVVRVVVRAVALHEEHADSSRRTSRFALSTARCMRCFRRSRPMSRQAAAVHACRLSSVSLCRVLGSAR